MQRQVPIASELLVDDEAVAVQRPAGDGIQHATGKRRAAPHQVGGEIGQRRAGPRIERAPSSRRGTPKSSTAMEGGRVAGWQGDG